MILAKMRAKTRINLAKIDTAVWAMQEDDLILSCLNLNANWKGQKHAEFQSIPRLWLCWNCDYACF
jgi:hypothetical protein